MMTDMSKTAAEITALALLRSGRSYAEAMQYSGLSLERIESIWRSEAERIQANHCVSAPMAEDEQ